ncbi:hypothetical protein V1L52_12700 [Treponema sp. HNW]|uniref:hypothetical protein n=1 Tax=Treponema sp. HNW TaxID=3116654 RepID=UPI003D10D077
MSGCAARASLTLHTDNSAVLAVKTRGGKTLEETAAAFTGTGEETALLDQEALRKNFASAGFVLTESALTGKTGIELKASAAAVDKSAVSGMLKTEKNAGEEIITLTLSPEYMRKLIQILPEETAEYTEFLMAPLFTGEHMSSDEYAELIGAMYGKAIRADLEKAFFNFDVNLPSAVTRAEIAPRDTGVVRINGKKAEFQLSLNKFLSNSDKIKICIWCKI